MASAQMIEADPMGDVILLLGDGSVGVRASSRVLSLASPVFAAMLGNRWLGDKSLSTTEPAIIPLPEDHIGAVTRLCRVLHYQSDVTEPIDFNTFENLALLCHKYDFVRAIFPWSSLWIGKFRLRNCGPRSYHSLRLLYISYALGNHLAFNKSYAEYLVKGDRSDTLGKRHTYNCPLDKDGSCPGCRGPHPSAEVDKLTRESGSALLPDGLLAAMEDHRKEELSVLHARIENILEEHMNKYPYPALSRDCCVEYCRHFGAEIGFVLSDLAARQLWPKYQCLREHTLYSATRELIDFEDFNPKHCDCRPDSIQAAFYNEAFNPEESRGLCLSCVKRGKYSVKSGNCQSSYSHPDCEMMMGSKKRKRDNTSPSPI